MKLKIHCMKGLDSIREKELKLLDKFIQGIYNIENIEIIGKKILEKRTGILSLDFTNNDNGIISHELSKNFGIMTRCGMHCAPLAHKTLGTFPRGTLRFGISHFNTLEEIEYTINSINNIIYK
ncbi:MAG: aminotransferase class V-fold PLP-dependent enzyme [Bacillota bacterium]|nr:aminotransferase class V-fold PLP-dependent enzyme [Bacillota bacterium]